MKKQYASVPINDTRLTWPYIAGLVDAEGCIDMRNERQIAISVAQHSCERLLHALKGKLGIGCVTSGTWTVTGSQALDVVAHIRPYCIIKRQQIETVMSEKVILASSQKRKRTQKQLVEWRPRLKTLSSLLKKQKRETSNAQVNVTSVCAEM